MRDLLLTGAIAAFLMLAIRRPFVGIIVWAWFTIMTPHQLAYGVYGVPLNAVIAIITLAGFVYSGAVFRFRPDPISILIILLCFWLAIAQFFSLDAENSLPYTDRYLKTLLFVLLCAQMATTKLRIHALLWVLTLGIGFFAAKGALFTIVTFGEFRVQGLPDTVIEDNNHFALATAVILPLILYLAAQAKHAWMRYALIALFALSILAIIGTHSRGGLIALFVFGVVAWFHARHKVSLFAGFVCVLAMGAAFMPPKWVERMETIPTAAEDRSFAGRVDAWLINWKLALEYPITGAGLRNPYQTEIAETVDFELAQTARAAHSIYFEMMGGTGFVGLLIYLLLFGAALLSTIRIVSLQKETKDAPWKSSLAKAIQTALIVFAVGGAAVSMEMWDGYLMLIALTAAIRGTMARATPAVGYALRTEISHRRTAFRETETRSQ